jgi:hypothetical protein
MDTWTDMDKTGRRLGRFKVDDEFFRELGHDVGVNLFVGMAVLDIRHDVIDAVREYVAAHRDFRPVREGERIPLYRAVFRDGVVLPEWQEIVPTRFDEATFALLANLFPLAPVNDGSH